MDQHPRTDDGFLTIKNTDLSPVLTSLASLCEETVLHDVTLVCNDGKKKSSRVEDLFSDHHS